MMRQTKVIAGRNSLGGAKAKQSNNDNVKKNQKQ
jgi:hypothetical protein